MNFLKALWASILSWLKAGIPPVPPPVEPPPVEPPPIEPPPIEPPPIEPPPVEPPPVVPPPTPTSCTKPLNGVPLMSIKPHTNARLYDATPLILNADRCTAVGMAGRQKCPVTLEGDPERGICEQELMGGVSPVWEIRNVVGTLTIQLLDGWFGKINGVGSGEIQASFPNGKANSPWIKVSF